MAKVQRPDEIRARAIELLGRGVCSPLPVELVEALLENGRAREFPSGQTMYAEADSAGLAIVLDGLVRVYMHAGDGRQVTVRYVRGGGLLGVPSLLAGPAPVFVQSIADATVFVLDGNRVGRLARADGRLAWVLAQEAAYRLYDVLEELAGNTFGSVRQRVARHLLDLAAATASPGPLTARVNQQDLANSTGSVREVVARVLAELRAARLVRTSPGRVEILDPVRLSRQLWSRQRDESHSA